MNFNSPEMNMTVLRRLMKQREIASMSLLNVARTIFKPGVKVNYRVIDKDNCVRDYFGQVMDVIAEDTETFLMVENLTTKRSRKIKLIQILGYF